MNVFELFAKIGLDTSEYDEGLDDSEKKASSFSSKLGSVLKSGAKIGGAAIAASSAAVTGLVKNSIENYAEYEQLVGGVETLFKDNADTVQKYAAVAYKTAGLSANEYMETVTSFSASLLQSLGGDTAEAAKIADMAIIDMSDNANKMGSDMASIQVAYQGFAKQNYTMLDNLKLGYGGTKTEMERLITDAEALDSTFKAVRDENGGLAMSYADVVNAIHIVQTGMDITGTTAKEASITIQGSLSAVKSSWSNLIVGVADENANFDNLIDDFVDSTATVAENLLPRIEQALMGIGELIERLAPVILDALPTLISEVLPSLLDSAVSLLRTVVRAIVDNLPMLLQTAADLVTELATGIAQALPDLIPTIVNIVLQIVETLIDNADLLIDSAIALILGLTEGIINAVPILIEKLPEIVIKIVNAIIENAPKLLEAGLELIVQLIIGIGNALVKLYEVGKDIIERVKGGISAGFTKLKERGAEIIGVIKNGIMEKIEQAKTWGKDLIDNFVQGIKDKIGAVKDAVTGVADKIKGLIGFSEPTDPASPLHNFHTFAPDMMKLFAQGIKDNEDLVTDQIEKSFDFGDRTIKAITETDSLATTSVRSRGDLVGALTEAVREALDGFEIDWNGRELGRLIQRYA